MMLNRLLQGAVLRLTQARCRSPRASRAGWRRQRQRGGRDAAAGRGQERGSRRPSRRTTHDPYGNPGAGAHRAPNGYKVDVSRGQRIGRVSSEWFNRPDDERYLSLTDLNNSVKRRSERSKTRIVESEAIRVEASRDNPERLTLMLPDAHAPVAPTHWSLVSSPVWSARRRPICASCRPRSPASICNMAFPHTAPSRSRRSRSRTAASSFER
jgi:hypothetical protein